MTTLRAPAPQTVMLHPSHDGRLYTPAGRDEPSLLASARLLAQRMLACAADGAFFDAMRRERADAERAGQAEEAAALVAAWKALSHAQRA